MKSSKIIVLDASAIIATQGQVLLSDMDCHISPEVLEEIRSSNIKRLPQWFAISDAFENDLIKIQSANETTIATIIEKINDAGYEKRLSYPDITALALTLDLHHLGAVLYTDDYAIQNIAAMINLSYKSIATNGIKEIRKFYYECTGCKLHFSRKETICPTCGSKIKRRQLK